MARKPTKFTADLRTKFLERFAVTGRITECANFVGLTGQTIRDTRKDDKAFDADFQDALSQYHDKLEQIVESRAVDGVMEPIYQRGVLVGHKCALSDQLLLAHAKRHIPEYREKHQVDVTHSGGVLVVPGVAKDSHEWERGGTGSDEETG